MSKNGNRAVLVTTEHRGVFFGHLESQENNSVVLTECRCAIYWNTKGGFLELAEIGPNEGSRIGSTALRVELYDVTSIADVTPEAVEKWKSA